MLCICILSERGKSKYYQRVSRPFLVKESRGEDPAASKRGSVVNTLNISMLDSIIGNKGEMSKGVYKYTIGRTLPKRRLWPEFYYVGK